MNMKYLESIYNQIPYQERYRHFPDAYFLDKRPRTVYNGTVRK